MVYVFITRKSFRVEPATRDEPLALFLSRRDGCPKIILSLMYICPKRKPNIVLGKLNCVLGKLKKVLRKQILYNPQKN